MPFLFIIIFSVMAAFAVLLPTVVYHLENLGATSTQATQVLACYSLAQFFAGPFLGRLSDIYGRKPVLGVGLLGALTAYSFLHFSSYSLFYTLTGLVFAGFSAGIVAVVFASVTDMTASENRAKGMGAMGAGIGLAFTVGPALGAFLGAENAGEASITNPAIASIGFILLGLIGWSRLVINKQATSEVTPNPTTAWAFIKKQPFLLQIAVIVFLFAATTALFEPVMPLLLKQRYEWGPRELGSIFGYVGLVIIIVQGGLVGRLARKFGEQKLVSAGVLLQLLGLLVLIYTPIHQGVIVGLTCTSVGAALFNTNMLALVSKHAGEARRGLVLGGVQSMMAIGRSSGPIFAGFLFALAPNLPMIIGGLISASVLMWVIILLLIVKADQAVVSGD